MDRLNYSRSSRALQLAQLFSTERILYEKRQFQPVSLAEICGGLSVNGRGVGWNNDVQYLKEKENPTCKCTNQPNKYITSMVLSTVQIILSVE